MWTEARRSQLCLLVMQWLGELPPFGASFSSSRMGDSKNTHHIQLRQGLKVLICVKCLEWCLAHRQYYRSVLPSSLSSSLPLSPLLSLLPPPPLSSLFFFLLFPSFIFWLNSNSLSLWSFSFLPIPGAHFPPTTCSLAVVCCPKDSSPHYRQAWLYLCFYLKLEYKVLKNTISNHPN